MKKHYFCSISCLALLCVFAACSDDNKSSSSKNGQDASGMIPPPPPEPSVLVEKRAERLGIAKLFPKEMGMMAGVYDIPGMMKSVQNLNMVKKWIYDPSEESASESIDIPGETPSAPARTEVSFDSPVIDAMIGLGPEWAPWMDRARDFFTTLGQLNMDGSLFYYKLYQSVKEDEKLDDKDLKDRELEEEAFIKGLELIDLIPSQDTTVPVMIAVKLTPEALAQAKDSVKESKLPEELSLHGIVSLYEKTYNGLPCKVAEVNCEKVREKLEEDLVDRLTNMMDPSQEKLDRIKAVLARLGESKLYVAVSFVDDTLVCFITTNPEKQIRIASSPQDSVLSHPDFSMADAQLQYPAYGLLFADKAAARGLANLDLAYYRGMLSGVENAMKVIGTDWRIANLAPSMAALDSIKSTLLGIYEKTARNATPISFYAWQDQGVHVEATYPDAFEPYKLDKPSVLSAVRPSASTVLYFSCVANPQIRDMYTSLCGHFAQIIWDYGNAYIADPKHKVGDQERMAVSLLQIAKPSLEELWKAYKTALSGLTGTSVFIMDMQGEPNSTLQGIPAPRFSAVYEVKDRAALAEAWQKVTDTTRSLITLASQGQMAELPAAKTSVDGDITTYDYECPLGAELNPVVSVSDTRWAISMPKAFGLEAIKDSMKAPAPVAPLEFHLNLLPLRDALKKSADCRETVENLDIITSDITGVHATGSKAADGRNVYHIHIIPASK